MKQLSLAAHNYESSYGKLPYGTNRCTKVGPLVMLLPYIEQENLYRLIDPRVHAIQAKPATGADCQNPEGDWVNALWPTTFAASRHRVKTFECPSDDAYAINTGTSGTDRGGVYSNIEPTVTGITLWYYWASDLVGAGGLPGLTNYVPSAGTTGFNNYPSPVSATRQFYSARMGAFSGENQTTVPGITDGSSNTVLFAEYVGAHASANGGGAKVRVMAWMGAGGFPSYWSMTANPDRFSYGSKHTGIANVSFGDGSVRPLRKGNTIPGSAAEILNRTNTAWDTLQSLTGKGEGDVIKADVIGN
jgi:prepilin-type processing-associated H-X9-DG protein